MGYAELTLILVLIGYLHVRISTAEKRAVGSISEDETEDMIDHEVELIDLQTATLEKRMDRLEESLDRIHMKLDSTICKES